MMDMFLILAQPGPQTPQSPGAIAMIFPIAVVVLLMYFIVMRPEKQKRRRQEALLNQLKKNDRVVTIGGAVGVIVDVKDKEVVLKVDESNNTKIRIKRWAIRDLVDDSKPDDEK